MTGMETKLNANPKPVRKADVVRPIACAAGTAGRPKEDCDELDIVLVSK